MYDAKYKDYIHTELQAMKDNGLYKETISVTTSGAEIKTADGENILNFCSNDYLSLSQSPIVADAAYKAVQTYGCGTASPRHVCGTLSIHVETEQYIANFFDMDDAILFPSISDAECSIFETLFGREDAVIMDEQCHASLNDATKMGRAIRSRYRHTDMEDLENQLKISQAQRFRIIVTDGVFGMDGDVAPLKEIHQLADHYHALVMVDDSHGVGILGENRRGTIELHNASAYIDLLTINLGNAAGGTPAFCIVGRSEIIDVIRQRARPYLFSAAVSPMVCGAVLAAFKALNDDDIPRQKALNSAQILRKQLTDFGFEIKPSQSLICTITFHDFVIARIFAEELRRRQILVTGFFFPVVPKNQTRLRLQITAAHTQEQILRTANTFRTIGHDLKIIE